MRSGYSGQHNKRAYALGGLLLVCLFYAQAQKIGGDAATFTVPELLQTAYAIPVATILEDRTQRLVREDPLSYWNQARENCQNSVRDFTCNLTKQELIGGRMSAEQEAKVKFREGPFSVFMHVVKNPGKARRILFVRDKYIKDGQQQAVIEPESTIARLFVRSVRRPIEGAEAQKQSRRLITEFGFVRTLDLMIKFAELSKQRGLLDVRYVGEGEVDGRPTYIFERHLPSGDEQYDWPDSLLVVHMDQEWHLPVACFSYADSAGSQLLGRYKYTKVNLNVGLQAADFEPETYGL